MVVTGKDRAAPRSKLFFSAAAPPVPPKINPPVVYTLLANKGSLAIHTDDEVVYSALAVTDADGSTSLLINIQGFSTAEAARYFLHELMEGYQEGIEPQGLVH